MAPGALRTEWERDTRSERGLGEGPGGGAGPHCPLTGQGSWSVDPPLSPASPAFVPPPVRWQADGSALCGRNSPPCRGLPGVAGVRAPQTLDPVLKCSSLSVIFLKQLFGHCPSLDKRTQNWGHNNGLNYKSE